MRKKGETVLPMVNNKGDITSYENCDYKRQISDGNALYDAFIAAKRGSSWKPQVQKFENDLLSELAKLQTELESGTFELSPVNQFILSERGKTRVITADHVRDRVVKHSLCDEVLSPAIRKYLIHDNSASLTGRGLHFARNRLETHLRKYYNQNKSNEGYILLMDYSKYYDNIRHQVFKDILNRYVHDPLAMNLISIILHSSEVGVDEVDYIDKWEGLFNYLEYYKEYGTSKPSNIIRLKKHMCIGDQVAQIAGTIYPNDIDTYIKIVKSIKYYGRYMDDSYIIHRDYNYLLDLLHDITDKARCLGITVNKHKSIVRKLSNNWRYLKIQYALTNTGRVVHKISTTRLSEMRRSMKKLRYKVSESYFTNWYNSWFKGHYKYMSKLQRKNLDTLFHSLKGEQICTQ